MSTRADADALAALLGEGAAVSESFGEVTLDVPRERIAGACAAALDAGYDFLMDLAATDYQGFAGEGVAGYWASPAGAGARDINFPASTGLGAVLAPPGSKRFAVSYQLLDRASRPPRRLRLRTWADEGEPVPSAVGIFPCADYQEREAWDLMGIRFSDHPNLERIFLPEGWDGHPHRKDYPIGGEPVQFSDEV
ncbi:MAG TPA: NADH-quinone oxidoreductase subunit C [Gaiellales bacterium]|jgi:NADH:ubiquinone oxidoreductase subunit C|nr:NADH-quinone oxidoreductase subunit C [Gaiellales bacterium]